MLSPHLHHAYKQLPRSGCQAWTSADVWLSNHDFNNDISTFIRLHLKSYFFCFYCHLMCTIMWHGHQIRTRPIFVTCVYKHKHISSIWNCEWIETILRDRQAWYSYLCGNHVCELFSDPAPEASLTTSKMFRMRSLTFCRGLGSFCRTWRADNLDEVDVTFFFKWEPHMF